MSRKLFFTAPLLVLALGFRLDAALEALGLRLYTGCVFVTLASQ
jgi:hypothetical protein